MFELIKKSKVPSLEPKKSLVHNDIDIEEYDLLAVFTVIFISIMFLVSMKVILIAGHL